MDENKMSTIKIHLSDIASNNIQQIIRDRVFKTNKVILEGIYLFHIYLLHIISSDIHMEIVSRTVRRCMLCLLTGARNSNKDCNEDEDEMIKNVKEFYFNFSIEGRENDFKYSDAITKPLEDISNTYITNMSVHIALNFKKYQKRYLLCKLKQYCIDNNYDISEQKLKFILHAIQKKINGKT